MIEYYSEASPYWTCLSPSDVLNLELSLIRVRLAFTLYPFRLAFLLTTRAQGSRVE